MLKDLLRIEYADMRGSSNNRGDDRSFPTNNHAQATPLIVLVASGRPKPYGI